MKFKKGSKVEIMNKDVPASWRVAEIVTGNGHGFNVRYDGYEGVEKVSRRLIRPSPPAVGLQSWCAGDIVEVFDESSWKIATVLKVLKGGQVLVRPHGFSHEMKVHKTNIRARQSWIDGKWIAIGKISGSYGIQAPLAGSKICQEQDDYDNTRLQESHVVSKSLKRASPFCPSFFEVPPAKAKKVKLAEKDRSQRNVSSHPFKKNHNWRHASLASKGPNKILVLLHFSWKAQWDISASICYTDKIVVCCHWHLSEQ